MLKLSLVVMFVLSLATLSFASSLMPMPDTQNLATIEVAAATPIAMSPAEIEPRAWIQTFE